MNNQAESPVAAAQATRRGDAAAHRPEPGLIQRLALLAGSEKAVVAGLVIIGQAMVAYARATQPDP